ncbi:MAG: CapA family protein, partial [Lachnospiraceae bacterium]|nr:CapA family protein [Lachnospiraceae bacterium]
MEINEKRVKIRNNHKDYRKTRKRKTAIIWTVVILVLAVLVAGGIYFHGDEKIKAIYESMTSSDEDTSSEIATSEESKTDGTNEIATNENGDVSDTANATTTENEETTVVFTGDVEISTYAQRNYDAYGIDGLVTEELRKELTEADILEVNNEFCFSTRGTQAADKQYTFRVNPSYVSVLTDLGVDVAGLA